MANQSQQVLSLIEDTPEFTLLDEHFKRFNPLKVLQVDNYEIRHSNMLSWLMNPAENHNLGTYVFRKMLAKVFVNPANLEDEDKVSNYDILQLCNHSYHDLVVFKELSTHRRKRIDLLAVSASCKVALLIENKYWSSESAGQLEAYIEYVRSEYPDYQVIPVFLTLQDEEPSHEDYLMLGYSDILSIMENLLQSQKDYMNPQIYDYLSYYIDILEDQLSQNEKMNSIGMALYKGHKEAIELLCAQQATKSPGSLSENGTLAIIYSQHKETIDFIKRVGDSFLKAAFLKFVQKRDWPEYLFSAHFRVPNFLEKTWYELYKEEDLRKPWWMNRGLIAWFERSGERLKLRVEVGPLEHGQRVKLLQLLAERGLDIKERSFEEGSQYTRIYMAATEPDSWEDVHSLAAAMEHLYTDPSYQSFLELVRNAVETAKGAENPGTPLLPPGRVLQTNPLEEAFQSFVVSHRYAIYNINYKVPSFIEPEWAHFPSGYEPLETYWLGFPLIAWFRIRNSTLRLIIEVGPIESGKRRGLLELLEQQGIHVRAMAFEEGRKFTRIFSNAVPITDYADPSELGKAMTALVESAHYTSTRKKIRNVLDQLSAV